MTKYLTLLPKKGSLFGFALVASIFTFQAEAAYQAGAGVETISGSDNPFVVKFHNYAVDATCSGSLITPDTILTAAHCFGDDPSNIDYSNTEVTIGSSRDEYDIQQVTVHPNWNGKQPYSNNLAIVKLNKCVDPSIANPGTVDFRQVGLDENMYQLSNELSTPSGNVESDFSRIQSVAGGEGPCYSMHKSASTNGNIICTKINPKSNICFGDVGGPLVLASSNEIVGISSHFISPNNKKCNAANSVGVFTNLKNYKDFLTSNGITCTGPGCDTSSTCQSDSSTEGNDTNTKNRAASFDNDNGDTSEDIEIDFDYEPYVPYAPVCMKSLITTEANFESTSVRKDFDASDDYTIPCKNNAFELTFEAQSQNDLYVRMYIDQGYVTKKYVDAQLGFKSGRNSIFNGVGLQKRSILSNGGGKSQVILTYNEGDLKVSIDNSITQTTLKDAPALKSLRFATFTDKATIYGASVRCINDDGC